MNRFLLNEMGMLLSFKFPETFAGLYDFFGILLIENLR